MLNSLNKVNYKDLKNVVDLILKKGKKLILIAGPSASGKSLIAKELKSLLEKKNKKVLVISTDDYYKDNTLVLYLLYGSYDHPNLINFKLLNKHLFSLLNNKRIFKPVYSFEKKMIEDFVKINSNYDFIIVEGIYTLNFISKKLLKEAFKIFIQVDKEELIVRRIIRDPSRTKEPLDRILNSLLAVFPMWKVYGEKQIKKADLIIVNDYEIIKEKGKVEIEEEIKNKEILKNLKNVKKEKYLLVDYYYGSSKNKEKDSKLIVREIYKKGKFIGVSIIKKILVKEENNKRIFKKYEVFINSPGFLNEVHTLLQLAGLNYLKYEKKIKEIIKNHNTYIIIKKKNREEEVFEVIRKPN
jgi:uridine kinase